MSWKTTIYHQIIDGKSVWRGSGSQLSSKFNLVPKVEPTDSFMQKNSLYREAILTPNINQKLISIVPELKEDNLVYAHKIVPLSSVEKEKELQNKKIDLHTIIKEGLNRKISKGFIYKNERYQINNVDQMNMNSIQTSFLKGVSNAHGGYWRTYNNKEVSMTDEEVQEFFDNVAAYKMQLIREAHKDKNSADESTDLNFVLTLIDKWKNK